MASRISSKYSRRSLGIDDLTEDGIPDPGLQGIDDNEVRLSPREILEVELEVHEVVDWPQGATDGTSGSRENVKRFRGRISNTVRCGPRA